VSHRSRIEALERRRPQRILLILDAVGSVDDPRVIAWPRRQGTTVYARCGESAEGWAARTGFDVAGWCVQRMPL